MLKGKWEYYHCFYSNKTDYIKSALWTMDTEKLDNLRWNGQIPRNTKPTENHKEAENLNRPSN